jgi:NADH:ubiquinone oxidoreductase subunit 6 (subunit J)
MSQSKIISSLTYLGTIPFILAAFFLLLGIKMVPSLGATTYVISIYGLVIASFMAGSHWGQHITASKKLSTQIYFMSNLMALSLWMEFLVGSLIAYFGLLIAVFILSLWIDYLGYQKKMITSDYMNLRWRVTSVVVLSLSIVEYCIL